MISTRWNKKNSTLNIATCLGILSLGIALIVIILYCFQDGISGNDFWWHVKVGEWICENGRIPTKDIFSWYGMTKNIDWTAHEWLSDVIFYFIYSTFGQLGIFLLALALALLMVGLMVYEWRTIIADNLLLTGGFLALFAVTSSMFFYGRPHLFSFFLLYAELKILYKFVERPETRKIFLLPLIGCLWSNLHGGSSNLSYILCVLFLVVGMINLNAGRVVSCRLSKSALVRLGTVSILTMSSILINPIGVSVFLYPYQSLSDELMMKLISEWAPPDAKLIGHLIAFFLPILLMTIGIVLENKQIRLIDLIIMLAFFYLFFRSVRFIVLWYIAAIFYAAPYIPRWPTKDIKQKWEKVVLYVAVGLMVIPLATSVSGIVKNASEDKLITTVMTDEAIEFVKTQQPDRIYNDYNLGEALIYHELPVFVDARADLYAQEHILEDGISLLLLQQLNTEGTTTYVDVDALVEKYSFDAILILKTRPLYSYLISHSDKYVCLYEDETVGYFMVLQ